MNSDKRLNFEDYLIRRPKPKGIDVHCQLKHFAIITYTVPPTCLSGLISPRFKLDTIYLDGSEKALISVVPFIDIDFASAVYPSPKFTMGQTNYRIYVIDKLTGERGVWFLGTVLDSPTWVIPRYGWKLPWHKGTVKFDCTLDNATGLYTRYNMTTKSKWAPASVELTQTPTQEIQLLGFPNTETGLVHLTHPLTGFYYRTDRRLGMYRVWHKQLQVKAATLTHANFGLLDKMGIVSLEKQQNPYSVLVEPLNEFTIYLPPEIIP